MAFRFWVNKAIKHGNRQDSNYFFLVLSNVLQSFLTRNLSIQVERLSSLSYGFILLRIAKGLVPLPNGIHNNSSATALFFLNIDKKTRTYTVKSFHNLFSLRWFFFFFFWHRKLCHNLVFSPVNVDSNWMGQDHVMCRN